MSNLAEYFRIRQLTDKALDRYNQFAKGSGWDIGGPYGKLDLYGRATQAFASKATQSEKKDAFRSVYDTVQNWPGVKRNGSGFASAEDVYVVLAGAGRKFLNSSGLSLANLPDQSSAIDELEGFLPRCKSWKQVTGYSHMFVAKVLHFANPGLFPIYDNKVVWEGVMTRAFGTEYRSFCRNHRFHVMEWEPKFLVYYTLWAAGYIRQANDEFMDRFVNWIELEYPDDITKYGVRQELHGFYATAFEFVAIGAACLEGKLASDTRAPV
jgi:hypothetical protein